MEIDKIKEEMLKYQDYYGWEFRDLNEIRDAKTKKELAQVIDDHDQFLENCVNDAQSSLERLKKRLELTIFDLEEEEE